MASVSIVPAVANESDMPEDGHVLRVFARVDLQSSWRAEVERRRVPTVVVVSSATPGRLSVRVSLSAEISDGRRITARTGDFGISGPRSGIWHRWHGPPLPEDPEEAARMMLEEHHVDQRDIEDGINQMLGRDPDLHHPPRLSWDGLITTLAEAGVRVTDRDLIHTPFSMELTPEVQAALRQP